MISAQAEPTARQRIAQWPELKIWHLGLLVLYVAVMMHQILDQRPGSPLLAGLAVFGFVGYAVLGWMGWRIVQVCSARFGAIRSTAFYLIAMALLFLAATWIYLAIEYAYTLGYF